MRRRDVRPCIFLLLLWPFGAAAAADEPREYRVLPDESEVDILVFRAGALGRFGHNHVVTARNLTGSVTVGDTAGESAFELTLPVADLVVDDPEARAEAGSEFESDVSEEDRTGTRRNMLGEELLEAAQYPEVRVRSTDIAGDFDDMTVTAEIAIRGGRHTVELPVTVVFYGERLIATGRATLTHADIGLSPFTAAFGALTVADEITFRYRIAAAMNDDPQTALSGRERALAVVQHDRFALSHGAAE